MPTPDTGPVRLAGRTLRHSRHICAFFNSREEQDRVLMPFFKEGYERGEKLFHVVDVRQRETHLKACQSCGIDVDAAQASGQLDLRHWEDSYLKDGHFDGARMMRGLEEMLEANRKSHGLTRLMGNMEWALEAAPGVTDIVEYETKLNYLLPRYPDPVVCVYDLKRHSGSVVMDVLRTHPMIILGGVLRENPLFVPPGQFLEELAARRQAAAEVAVQPG